MEELADGFLCLTSPCIASRHQLTVANEEALPPPLADDGDISDPDEDTLAGQIAMMKGQRVKKADGQEDDEEDEDDSSDEEGGGGRGSDSSDSDSEDEAPRGKKVVDSSDSDSD
jgi:translocation protein SEC63